jgi:simple sugar transport system ATP-binding protein
VEFKDRKLQHFSLINRRKTRKLAQERVKQFDVRPANPQVDLAMLSGGNAQKVVVARELAIGGKLLVAAQPTRGVDVGAIESIRAFLNQATKDGSGVLLISADLDEIMTLSDRIIVMFEGRISGELLNDGNINEMSLGLLMTGGK